MVTPELITAAGGYVSLAVLFLTVTGLLRWLTRHIPVPVVKGIQLGAGLNLVSSVGGQVMGDAGRIWLGYVSAACLIFVLTQPTRRIPFALAIFLLGLGIVSVSGSVGLRLRPWVPKLAMPGWANWDGVGMALGQLPLTTLNSIVAASALAGELAPERPVSVNELGYSVAGMNLVGCWFGAMPVCHGAGGLAAQWRFGARSGASIVLLGLAKLILGLAFGDGLMGLIGKFPGALLGVMVLGAGLELARVAVSVNEDAMDLWEEDGMEYDAEGVVVGMKKKRRVLAEEERKDRWMVLLVTMAGIVAFRNDAIGFLGGMGCFWFCRLGKWWDGRNESRMLGELSI